MDGQHRCQMANLKLKPVVDDRKLLSSIMRRPQNQKVITYISPPEIRESLQNGATKCKRFHRMQVRNFK